VVAVTGKTLTPCAKSSSTHPKRHFAKANCTQGNPT